MSAKETREFDLVLAGGSLKTCSSMSVKNCSKTNSFSDGLSSIQYRITSEKRDAFFNSEIFSPNSKLVLDDVHSVFLNIYNKLDGAVVSKSQLRDAFADIDQLDFYKSMSDELYFAFHDYIEFPQILADGNRKQEHTNLAFNKNSHAVDVYQAFYNSAQIKAARKQQANISEVTPHIVVVTASSRDPFESADFYQSVFQFFKAKVTWLPLDMTYQQAKGQCQRLQQIRANNLSFNRDVIYPKRVAQQKAMCEQPERMLEAIKSADGIFFNGGDQSRTIAALTDKNGQPAEELIVIRNMVENKQLVVGGTSAGTAVQAGGFYKGKPVPMISNGDPKLALVRGAFATKPPSARCSKSKTCQSSELKPGDLTYRAEGGTGLFELGLLDTHFSERDRESRLAVFSYMSGQRFAFGVDETSALLVNKQTNGDYHFEVVGQNGVFVVDMKQGQGKIVEAESNNYIAGLSHFLNQGDKAIYRAELDQLLFTFNSRSESLSKRMSAKGVVELDGKWRAVVGNKCGKREVIGWQNWQQTFAVQADDKTQFARSPNKQCSYSNLPFVIKTN
ncbi:MAG: cyanophycinase [Gammaproteobacteria bacterium]|nr:cyanophycinase [Gammaproteobacteria bacterium]